MLLQKLFTYHTKTILKLLKRCVLPILKAELFMMQ